MEVELRHGYFEGSGSDQNVQGRARPGQRQFRIRKGYFLLFGSVRVWQDDLVEIYCRLEVPDAGAISIADKVQTSVEDGILVPSYARKIGFVFQNYALWPHMTVFSNVAFGLKLRKLKKEDQPKGSFGAGVGGFAGRESAILRN